MKSASSAFAHTIVCYVNPIPALKQFSGDAAPRKDPLLAHVYGVKNVYTALVRIYALHHLDDRVMYNLAMATFAGVLFLYLTETFIWRTVRLREGMIPYITAGGGLLWMYLQRDFYVKK